MPKSVIIIHPSEIVRKGLLFAIGGELGWPVRCFEAPEDFMMNLPAPGHEIVFLLPAGFSGFEGLLKIAQSEKYHFYSIAIESCSSPEPKGNFDFVFHLNDPSRILIQQINSFFEEEKAHADNDELSAREKEVLRLIALGYTNKSIADKLFISSHTVISHRKNITDKLGIKSIPGLTVYAIVQKLISQDDIMREQE